MEKNSNILVTGGAGYIGSHTCKALAKAGYIPVTIDNLASGHRSAVRWGPFIEGDLSNEKLLLQIIQDYKVKAVMHFAADTYVGESMLAPGKYFHNNITNTLTLLNAMVCSKVQKFVFSSTCSIYGMPQHIPINENHPQQPINPYGESKLFIEKALRWYKIAHSIQSISLRYFNAAGADLDGEIGEDHNPETHLIPLVIQTALGQREQMQILGTDYETPDGTAIRDYIHVTDIANAHVKAMEYLSASGNSASLNIGTGKGYSVREVIKIVEDVSGIRININEMPRRAGDPPLLVAQCGLANELFGWEPQYSDLRSIITTAIRWHQQNHNSLLPYLKTEIVLDKRIYAN